MQRISICGAGNKRSGKTEQRNRAQNLARETGQISYGSSKTLETLLLGFCQLEDQSSY
jgi:hypothetical protein